MLNICCFFVLFIAVKIDSKLTLHYLEKVLLYTLTRQNFQIRRVTFFKSFLPRRNYGMDFWFSGKKEEILSAHWDEMNCRPVSWSYNKPCSLSPPYWFFSLILHNYLGQIWLQMVEKFIIRWNISPNCNNLLYDFVGMFWKLSVFCFFFRNRDWCSDCSWCLSAGRPNLWYPAGEPVRVTCPYCWQSCLLPRRCLSC